MLKMERDACIELVETFGKPLSDQELEIRLKELGCKTLEEFLPDLEKLVR
ncbi:MAG: hypothetical protein L0Y70_15800 [Gemmataceae bacterium]|nr:hypothetical protein [Gemmataceae bacterium]